MGSWRTVPVRIHEWQTDGDSCQRRESLDSGGWNGSVNGGIFPRAPPIFLVSATFDF
ncbi:MAG: hypothetical protein OJF51_001713 [Nitrospira sp.]|nr:MAG: hypothetical protein OJF51_001713 [Nitrospira sp.]